MDWYYRTETGRIGPLTDAQIRGFVSKGVITPDTMVWNELIGRWRPYREISDDLGVGQDDDRAVDSPSPEQQAERTPRCSRCDGPYRREGMDSSEDESLCSSCRTGTAREDAGVERTGYGGHASCGHSGERTSVGEPSRHQLEFTGSGSEYFRIWIVNLLLSVVTLGIYSAWAKVRKNQYFYRNTRLDGSGFDYHGNPVAILKGRLIAAGIIIGQTIAQNTNVYLYGFLFAVLIIALPWLITRSFAFRLHNSSWRSIRFRFHGSVRQAAVVFLGYGLLVPLSFGICYPLLYHRIRRFLYDNAAFGLTRGRLHAGAGPVYGVFLQASGLFIMAGLVSVMAGGVLSLGSLAAGGMAGMPVTGLLFAAIIYGTVILLVHPFFQAKMSNLLWNSVTLGSARFQSRQCVGPLAAIVAGNAVMTLVTLGLYWPWAAVRLARYRAETLTVVAEQGLHRFAADAEADVSAAGEEITDAFDVDISF